ncbi:MAG: hypothetical protein Q4C22_04930, partial [Bacillota bacterium]|nr:hypothetical protein [Bacillota bacterium]
WNKRGESKVEDRDKQIGPALFFCVEGELLFHGCRLSEGEPYGPFLNYPHSHLKIWTQNYEGKYGVDFDYYPRGRVVYRKADDSYLIYYDKCMQAHIEEVALKYAGYKYEIGFDEHYQCHQCNEYYVI